jgi:hypothetical protein
MNETKIIVEFLTDSFKEGVIDAKTMNSLIEHHIGRKGIERNEPDSASDNVSFATSSERTLKLVVNN